jgi:hypothetical protein
MVEDSAIIVSSFGSTGLSAPLEAPVFDQFNGLPMHPLVVHAAVVFVPLLALAALAYAFVPALRARVGWVAALLAVAAPAAAFVSMQSGSAWYETRYAGAPAEATRAVHAHAEFGQMTFFFSLGLGVVTGVLLGLTRGGQRLPKVAELGLAVVVLGLAIATGYYVFRTGDSGATSVHGG